MDERARKTSMEGGKAATESGESPSNHRGVGTEIVEAKVYLDVKGSGGFTTAILAACRGQGASLKIVVDTKADHHVKDNGGYTSATYAARRDSYGTCLRIIVDAKADLNVQMNEDFTAAILAAANGNGACFKIVVDAKAELDVKSNQSKLALAWALQQRKDGGAAFLCAAGAR